MYDEWSPDDEQEGVPVFGLCEPDPTGHTPRALDEERLDSDAWPDPLASRRAESVQPQQLSFDVEPPPKPVLDELLDGSGLDGKQPSMLFLVNALLALVWFSCSAGLSMFNKLIFGANHTAFPCPLLMTATQFLFQALLAAALVWCQGAKLPTLSASTYLTQVAPSALTFALDIGFSNYALVFLTVTFYTMCKSSAPLFLLAFAFCLRIEAPSCALLGIVLVICAGVLLTVAGETQFHAVGFVLVMAASFMSGLRWTLSQILLQKATLGLENPAAAILFMMPMMAGVLTPLSLLTEEPLQALPGSRFFDTPLHAAVTLGVVFAGALLACMMTMAEFQLLHNTSALTVMVLGMCKEVLTILVASTLYGDHLDVVNASGMALVLVGVGMYKLHRAHLHTAAAITAPSPHETVPLVTDVDR